LPAPLAETVIQAIQAAFAELPMPPADALKNDHCQECTDTWRWFLDVAAEVMTWKSAAAMPGKAIETSLLSVAAWRYYLPALLIWCVRDRDTVDVLPDNVAHTLSRRSDDWFQARSSGFSPAQRQSVALFLEWYQDWRRAGGCTPGEGPLRHIAKGIAFWRSDG